MDTEKQSFFYEIPIEMNNKSTEDSTVKLYKIFSMCNK